MDPALFVPFCVISEFSFALKRESIEPWQVICYIFASRFICGFFGRGGRAVECGGLENR